MAFFDFPPSGQRRQKAHDLLTRESWQSADLREIVADTVKPLAGGESRFQIEGPSIRLSPSAALAVAMALHELSTNAAKYGALTSEDGRVSIAWQLHGKGDERQFVLRWQESGDPRLFSRHERASAHS